jgi:hypothetical protein
LVSPFADNANSLPGLGGSAGEWANSRSRQAVFITSSGRATRPENSRIVNGSDEVRWLMPSMTASASAEIQDSRGEWRSSGTAVDDWKQIRRLASPTAVIAHRRKSRSTFVSLRSSAWAP